MAKSGRLELGDNFYGHYWSLFNHWDVFGQQRNRMRLKTQKRLLRRPRAFKVIEVGISRKPICGFLLVINSNWHPTSYRFGVIAAYCSNFRHFAFLSHAFSGLGTTHDVHLGLIGKRVVDFLLVLLELFSARCYGWGATSENRSKIGDFALTRSVWPKISGRRRPTPIIFARIVRPVNALQLCCWQFSHKETL